MSALVNSYFSGAGLLDLGLHLAGLRLQQSFEIDPVCCATLRRNFNHYVVEGVFLRGNRDFIHCGDDRHPHGVRCFQTLPDATP